MDIDKLISCVFTRPAIWDTSHDAHHNRFILDKLWEEVAAETGYTKINVKSKWKYLRDNFRKELAKQPKVESGEADIDNIRTSWPYFITLLFLKDQFGQRKQAAEYSFKNDLEAEEDVSDMLELSYDEPETVQQQQQNQQGLYPPSEIPSPSDSSFYGENSLEEPVLFKKRKTQSVECADEIKVRLLKEKLYRRYDCPSEEDSKFFESLLPHVRKIPPHQKLLFRSKLQEVVHEYAYCLANDGFQSPQTSGTHD